MDTRQFLFGSLPTSNSEAGTLNALDLKKTARMLVVIAAGAAATPILDYLSKWIIGVNFGTYTPLVTVVASSLLELARRWVAQHFPPETA